MKHTVFRLSDLPFIFCDIDPAEDEINPLPQICDPHGLQTHKRKAVSPPVRLMFIRVLETIQNNLDIYNAVKTIWPGRELKQMGITLDRLHSDMLLPLPYIAFEGEPVIVSYFNPYKMTWETALLICGYLGIRPKLFFPDEKQTKALSTVPDPGVIMGVYEDVDRIYSVVKGKTGKKAQAAAESFLQKSSCTYFKLDDLLSVDNIFRKVEKPARDYKRKLVQAYLKNNYPEMSQDEIKNIKNK